MPFRAPRVCACGKIIPSGIVCPCQAARARERKAQFDKKRPTARQRGYTAQWVRESKRFLAANPKCQRCDQPATLVDHVKPHKGDQRLFWDRTNWQPMCGHHHNSAKQSEERRADKEKKT